MRKNIAIFALLMGASIASAQTMKIHLSDGTTATYPAERVNYVEFIEDDTPGDNVHEYVDLGLPSGLLWATCNVGANSPEDYGDYFAWGETTTKSDYSWSTYKWMQSGYSDWRHITKYTCPDGETYGIWYNGDTFVGDNKTVLDPEDDAAHVNWGGSWRMPTKDEQDELLSNCTWKWTTQNGVKGQKVTGPNGSSIFLPAAGYRDRSSLYDAGSNGGYWSSSLSTSSSDYAFYLYFYSGYYGMFDIYCFRFCGQSVRPVRPSSE